MWKCGKLTAQRVEKFLRKITNKKFGKYRSRLLHSWCFLKNIYANNNEIEKYYLFSFRHLWHSFVLLDKYYLKLTRPLIFGWLLSFTTINTIGAVNVSDYTGKPGYNTTQ